MSEDVEFCESCDEPGTDDNPLVRCENYGPMHDSCHLATCQSVDCHRTVYADPVNERG